jgi:hypothetical protein
MSMVTTFLRVQREVNHRILKVWTAMPGTQRGCAADQHDERAPPHSITVSARNRNDSGIVKPSAFAVLRLITS